ncbi:hypothetical protein M426DRAFT_120744 [Hypoxylon sp. CI-4A]|nr:hypothetical protein M426DRAFT_120744 [Hypoxylon sp. CI-4A]
MSSAEIPPEILRDDSKRRELRTLFITMMTLPTVVVLIRTWSRALLPAFHMSKIPNKFWWDDWTVYIALALNIATCGMCLKLLDLGLGFHRQVVPQGVEPFLKLFWALYYVFDTGTAVSKASALFFYARLFGIANTRFKHALWVVHAMNGIWLVGVLLRALFMCSPIEKAWKSELPGHCNNTSVSWLGSVISSLVIDIIILVLPLPILWNLHMKAVRKIQITGVFVCGYL